MPNWWESDPTHASYFNQQQTRPQGQQGYTAPAQQALNSLPSTPAQTATTTPANTTQNNSWMTPGANQLVSPYIPGMVYNPNNQKWIDQSNYGVLAEDPNYGISQADYESQFINSLQGPVPNLIRGAVPLSEATLWNNQQWLNNPYNEIPSNMNIAPGGNSVASMSIPHEWLTQPAAQPPVNAPATPSTPTVPQIYDDLPRNTTGGAANLTTTPQRYDDLPRANTTPAGDEANFLTGFSGDIPGATALPRANVRVGTGADAWTSSRETQGNFPGTAAPPASNGPGQGQELGGLMSTIGQNVPGNVFVPEMNQWMPQSQVPTWSNAYKGGGGNENSNPLSGMLGGQMNRTQYNPLANSQGQDQVPSWMYSLMPYLREMGRTK